MAHSPQKGQKTAKPIVKLEHIGIIPLENASPVGQGNESNNNNFYIIIVSANLTLDLRKAVTANHALNSQIHKRALLYARVNVQREHNC